MKWIKCFLLLCALCLVGCNAGTGGITGDANDPAAPGGSDEEQMGDETGELT